MKLFPTLSTVLAAGLTFAAPTQAATLIFDLLGKAGPGLLRTNEAPAVPATGGSGGEVGAGISFDDATNILTINIAWGSGNGFTDLTTAITGAHVHFPTPSLPPASFNEATGVMVGFNTLPGFNASITNGGFSGTVTIPLANVPGLLQGRTYINVHTSTNGGGEIRGNIIPVPEPSIFGLLSVGLAGFGLRRRRG